MNCLRFIGYFSLVLTVLTSCSSQKGVQLPKDKKGFKKLSEYGLFVGKMSELHPTEHLIPYDLNTPLFSDYAQKARFVWVPEGKKATVKEDGFIDFPEGSILVKNFYYDTDTGRNIIETRLLIHLQNEWQAYPYIWNAEQTEAFLEVAGGSQKISFDHLGEKIQINYSIPNKNQCKSCHNNDNKMMPIGPKISNLNKMYTYVQGKQNQLDHWVEKEILDFKRTEETPILAVWDAPNVEISERVKAYLDVNCGHCHQPKGPGNTSGLFLQEKYFGTNSYGICKTPVAAGRGSGGRKVSIHPGHSDASILEYRMNSDDPGIMMPEIGRKLIHKEAVDLIRAWIDGMQKSECQSSASATTTSSSSVL